MTIDTVSRKITRDLAIVFQQVFYDLGPIWCQASKDGAFRLIIFPFGQKCSVEAIRTLGDEGFEPKVQKKSTHFLPLNRDFITLYKIRFVIN